MSMNLPCLHILSYFTFFFPNTSFFSTYQHSPKSLPFIQYLLLVPTFVSSKFLQTVHIFFSSCLSTILPFSNSLYPIHLLKTKSPKRTLTAKPWVFSVFRLQQSLLHHEPLISPSLWWHCSLLLLLLTPTCLLCPPPTVNVSRARFLT